MAALTIRAKRRALLIEMTRSPEELASNPVAGRVADGFARAFQGQAGWIVRAPGRVNLIGEHTDYNDGFVLPMAIDRAVWIALRPAGRPTRPAALARLPPDDRVRPRDRCERGGPGWGEYPKAVAWALQAAGHALRGWEGVLSGEVPLGAGLSSSAALELAIARAFAVVSDLAWQAPAMARLAQRAENEWVGVACGIMDQLTSACGLADHALLIDCRSLDIEPVPLPAASSVLVLDTGTRRGLVSSAYNQRRQECQEGAAAFGLSSLRDLTSEEFAHGEDSPGGHRAQARAARLGREPPHVGGGAGDAGGGPAAHGPPDAREPCQPARRL